MIYNQNLTKIATLTSILDWFWYRLWQMKQNSISKIIKANLRFCLKIYLFLCKTIFAVEGEGGIKSQGCGRRGGAKMWKCAAINLFRTWLKLICHKQHQNWLKIEGVVVILINRRLKKHTVVWGVKGHRGDKGRS